MADLKTFNDVLTERTENVSVWRWRNEGRGWDRGRASPGGEDWRRFSWITEEEANLKSYA